METICIIVNCPPNRLGLGEYLGTEEGTIAHGEMESGRIRNGGREIVCMSHYHV